MAAVTAAVVLAAIGYRMASAPGNNRLASGAFAGKNLLFVTIDTLRTDRLGSYGSDAGYTPHLDALASEGVRFDNLFAHVPVTLPSHASIFTGRYPNEHGVHDNGAFRLDDDVPTLASELRAAGYATGAFVAAFVLDARFGLNQGFDLYDDYYGEKRSFLSFSPLERRASAIVEPAGRFIRQAEKPWFAWLHLFDPHAPYDAPAGFANASDPYGAEVAYTDSVLGEFLGGLDEEGRLDDTVVVVLGDHGEALGDHGEKTHGTFAYNSTLRVPGILWAGDALAPRVFDRAVRHVDVMPTLLDLLGVEAPTAMSGQSLRPYLAGEPYEPPPTYFEALNVHLTRDWAPLRGVVQDGYKLVSLPIPELYHLEDDPTERRNLYADEPDVARKLEQTLSRLSGGDSAAPAEAQLPDRETMERLRALGYVTAPVANRKSTYTDEDDPKKLIEVSNAYDTVTELFGDGRVPEAVPILEDILIRQPRSSTAYQGLAYAHYQLGGVQESVAVLERGVAAGVQEPALLGMLGAYLLDIGQVEKAAGLLEALIATEPDYVEAHNYLGIAYGRLGKFDDARRELERVIELDPSSAASYNNLGSLAFMQGDLEGAVAALTRALTFDPGNANTLNGLGAAYARSGDTARAVEHWKRAVDASPQQFDALYNVALALASTSPQEALPYLKRFANEAPEARYRPDIARAKAIVADIEGRR